MNTIWKPLIMKERPFKFHQISTQRRRDMTAITVTRYSLCMENWMRTPTSVVWIKCSLQISEKSTEHNGYVRRPESSTTEIFLHNNQDKDSAPNRKEYNNDNPITNNQKYNIVCKLFGLFRLFFEILKFVSLGSFQLNTSLELYPLHNNDE